MTTALGSPPTQLGLSGASASMTLAQLIDPGVLAPAASSAAEVGMSVANLLLAGAQLANGNSALTVPVTGTLPAGLGGLSVKLRVIQPPVMAVGPARKVGDSPMAAQKDLRDAVRQGRFRADLFFRLAVTEMRIPSLEKRGMADKVALLTSFLRHMMGTAAFDALPPMPDWLKGAVGTAFFAGNVRELRNLAERVGIAVRQAGDWDPDRIRPFFTMLHPGAFDGSDRQADWRADGEERRRILAALDANGWRRQDTAASLGISRKVLWEKMRKYQIADSEAEPA